jgi:hypothetical protein
MLFGNLRDGGKVIIDFQDSEIVLNSETVEAE